MVRIFAICRRAVRISIGFFKGFEACWNFKRKLFSWDSRNRASNSETDNSWSDSLAAFFATFASYSLMLRWPPRQRDSALSGPLLPPRNGERGSVKRSPRRLGNRTDGQFTSRTTNLVLIG